MWNVLFRKLIELETAHKSTMQCLREIPVPTQAILGNGHEMRFDYIISRNWAPTKPIFHRSLRHSNRINSLNLLIGYLYCVRVSNQQEMDRIKWRNSTIFFVSLVSINPWGWVVDGRFLIRFLSLSPLLFLSIFMSSEKSMSVPSNLMYSRRLNKHEINENAISVKASKRIRNETNNLSCIHL